MTVTIDSGHISSNVTLSNSDLTATAGAASVGGLATAGYSSGKYYFEVDFTTLTSNSTGCGWALQTVNLSTFPAHEYYNCAAVGTIFNGTTSTGYSFQGWTQDTTGAIAIDFDNSVLWAAKDATSPSWNTLTSGTQDPGAGEGGIPFDSAFDDATLYPFFYLGNSGDSVTFTFLASGFVGTPPSGFSAVDPGT